MLQGHDLLGGLSRGLYGFILRCDVRLVLHQKIFHLETFEFFIL